MHPSLSGPLDYKPLGRPTDYDPKYCTDIITYFDVEPYFEREVECHDKKGNSWTEYKTQANDLPTLAGFASKIGVHRDTVHEWSKVYQDFSDAIKKAKEIQETILVTNGLKSLYNPAFAIFTAKNLIRWTDRQEINAQHSGSIGINISQDDEKL